jgi:predicted kinase
VIRSDVVRKELSGQDKSAAARFEEGLYTPEWTERTYDECLRRAERLFFEGRRVLVDASFRRESSRRAFLDAALRWGVPGVLLMCQAEPLVVRRRLQERRGDASDADWSIYEETAARWEAAGASTRGRTRVVNTGDDHERAAGSALRILAEIGLV